MLSTTLSALTTALPSDVRRYQKASETAAPPPCKTQSIDELLARRPYFASAFDLMRTHVSGCAVAVDLGCGHDMGDLRVLESYGCSLPIGVDILDRPATLSMGDGISYIRSDIDESRLPLTEESCDVVILNNILEHLHNPMNSLTEAVRVLRKGGLLVIITPNQADLKNRLLLLAGVSIHFPLRRWLLQGADRITKGTRSVFIGHVREYTACELTDMVSMIGCELVEVRYIPTARAQVSDADATLSTFTNHLDRMMRGNRLLFSVYSLMERIVPAFRAQISVVAKKM